VYRNTYHQFVRKVSHIPKPMSELTHYPTVANLILTLPVHDYLWIPQDKPVLVAGLAGTIFESYADHTEFSCSLVGS